MSRVIGNEEYRCSHINKALVLKCKDEFQCCVLSLPFIRFIQSEHFYSPALYHRRKSLVVKWRVLIVADRKRRRKCVKIPDCLKGIFYYFFDI